MFLFDGFVEFFEAGELRRETAFGGCVDDEDDFAFVVCQRVGVSFLFWFVSIVARIELNGTSGGEGTNCQGARSRRK